MIVSDIEINEEDVRIMKDILKMQKVCNFLKDKTNKSMIVILFTLLIYFIICVFVHDLLFRIAFYFAIYYSSNYVYDKIVDYLFRDCFRNSQ